MLSIAPCLAAAKTDGALVLHLRWRLVASGSTYVAASDRYVLIVKDSDSASAVARMLDQQTGMQRALSPPDCPSPDYSSYLETGARLGGPLFGGPWLMVTCIAKPYELYNLASGQWTSFTPSPQCGYSPRLGQGACVAVGVGSGWVKLFTTDGLCQAHCGVYYHLQNIFTGEFIADPATPAGTILDDLNAPSGSSRMCAPLRYPRSFNGDIQAWDLGLLSLYGKFALASGGVPDKGGDITAYRLQHCGTRLNLAIDTNPYYPAISPGPFAPPVASSRAVIWTRTSDGTLAGRLLPSLQPFTIRPPAPGVTPAALTKRTIYVRSASGNQVWAAALSLPTHQTKR